MKTAFFISSLLCVCLLSGIDAKAQNVGINSTGAAPNASAMLDIDAPDKGLLVPRIALVATNSVTPITSPATSLLVYNTASASSGTTAVSPGYYYWNGTQWVRLMNSGTGSGTAWQLAGNAGTNAGTDFLGTTDSQDLVFKTNSTEKMRLSSTGNLGIGNTAPASKLDITAGTTTVNTIVNAVGSINDYLQVNVQNTNAGVQAQSGYAATADNGSATTGFAWMGINNSTFNFPTAYNIGGSNDVSFLGSGQDLYIANAHNSKSIIFSTGKAASPYFNERMRITNSGNIGIGTATPNASALVEMSSTSQGFLLPRMTTAQMVAITSPAVGLMVYNLDCNILEYYNGSQWIKVLSSNNNASTVSSQVFSYTGSIQSFTVPSCVSSFTLKAWGAGGGGGGNDGASSGGKGGGGAYSTLIISASPGDVLQIWVGGYGNNGTSAATGGAGGAGGWGYCSGGTGGASGTSGSSGAGAGGGGSSAVKNSTTNTFLIAAAGGGGGGGAGNSSASAVLGFGGAGGQNGFIGGTGTSGGTTAGNSTCAGQVGVNRGAGDGGGSGAGGGGYTNGGGAGTIPNTDYTGGGGAGGNSLGTTTIGSGQTPGNSADADLCAGCATGGNAATVGTNGVVKIYWN